MSLKPYKTLSLFALIGAVALTAYVPVSEAFNFGNMMNPSRWWGDKDRYDEPYWDSPYGPYGGPGGGYGYPGVYGAPHGMPYGVPGFGAAPGAYGAPGYGVAPAAVAPAPQQAPAASSQSEVEALKRRIEELEAKQQQSQPPPSSDWPSAPAFRPMGQY